MKRYNRWSNLITSIVVDVFVGLFFIFASLPCLGQSEAYGCTNTGCYSYVVYYTLFGHPFGCCIATIACMFAFAILSTASFVMDILHAAGPFIEGKAYRILHICFSFTCFGLATTCVTCLSVASACYYPLSPIYLCLFCVCVLTAIEAVRFIFGIIAERRAKNTPASGTFVSREAKHDSDYAVKKLKDLKDLLSEGIISEEEYNEAKKKYIKDL